LKPPYVDLTKLGTDDFPSPSSEREKTLSS
jgi:hypothetical protein